MGETIMYGAIATFKDAPRTRGVLKKMRYIGNTSVIDVSLE